VGLDGDVVVRVLVAAALGAAIGLEREAAGQPAGLRTHCAVAIGAGLFGVVSTLGFEEFVTRRDLTNVQVDVTRVASNVAVGIGFLGAGLVYREGGHVRNLTTAASIWVSAAVGLAAGVGNLGAASLTTGVLIGTLVLLRPLRSFVDRTFVHEQRRVQVTVIDWSDVAGILEYFESVPGLELRETKAAKADGRPVVVVRVRLKPGQGLGGALSALTARPEVVEVNDELVG
jgi:putative Mg2+ transporter-C (MgtC) family protein